MSAICFIYIFRYTDSVYLLELVIFTVIFHIFCICHYKSVESIDDNLYKKNDRRKIQTKFQIVYPFYCWIETAVALLEKQFNSITESKMDLKLLLPKQRGEL